jgi:DNA-binding response OmpR family regulator
MNIAIFDEFGISHGFQEETLAQGAFACATFSNVKDFISAINSRLFRVFLVFANLPDRSHLRLAEWIRSELGDRFPILVLADRCDDADIVASLQSGADLMLPMDRGRESFFLATINALGRRVAPAAGVEAEVFGPYSFDRKAKAVHIHGEFASVTAKEFDVTMLLFDNLNRIVSRDEIIDRIWSDSANVSTRTIDVHVSKIRSKLKINPGNGFRISSVYRVGYRLEDFTAPTTRSRPTTAWRRRA